MKGTESFGDECVHWVPALQYGHAVSHMKRLKMPYRTISYRARVIFSLKLASHLTSRYSAPLLGSNLSRPLSLHPRQFQVFVAKPSVLALGCAVEFWIPFHL